MSLVGLATLHVVSTISTSRSALELRANVAHVFGLLDAAASRFRLQSVSNSHSALLARAVPQVQESLPSKPVGELHSGGRLARAPQKQLDLLHVDAVASRRKGLRVPKGAMLAGPQLVVVQAAPAHARDCRSAVALAVVSADGVVYALPPPWSLACSR
eukprot:scaffold208149_cov33-Tisochrysis_lutea.AAC.1